MTGEITRKSFILAEGYIPCDNFFILNIYIIACFTVKLLSSCESSCSFKMKSSVSCNPVVCRQHILWKTKTLSQCQWYTSTSEYPQFLRINKLQLCVFFSLLLLLVSQKAIKLLYHYFFCLLTPVAVPWDSYKCL